MTTFNNNFFRLYENHNRKFTFILYRIFSNITAKTVFSLDIDEDNEF